VGGRIDDEATLDEVVEIARLIARVHQIDIGWYDDIRRRHRKLVPALASASNDSHIWWYAAKSFFDGLNEAMLKVWIAAGPVAADRLGWFRLQLPNLL
jgi:hypothetical protein